MTRKFFIGPEFFTLLQESFSPDLKISRTGEEVSKETDKFLATSKNL